MKRFKNTAYSARLGEKIANEMINPKIQKPKNFSSSLYTSRNPDRLPTAIPVNRINEYLENGPTIDHVRKDLDELEKEYIKKRQDAWDRTMSKKYKGQTEVQAKGSDTEGFGPNLFGPPMFGKSNMYRRRFDRLSKKTGFERESKDIVDEWIQRKNDITNLDEASQIIKYGGIPNKDVTFYDGYRYCEIPKGYKLELQRGWGATLSKQNPDGTKDIVEFEDGKVTKGSFKYGKTSW